MTFEWDKIKNEENKNKHQISFENAQKAFMDPKRIILKDVRHSTDEERYFCFGLVNFRILTVRFTMRKQNIRIFGAGYWREGRKIYENKN